MNRTQHDKEYLGDGVYLSHDGFQIWLTSEDGISVLNEIAIEPHLIDRLVAYRDGLIKKYSNKEQAE